MADPIESKRPVGRILLLANVVLYLGLATVIVVNRAELRWAVGALPSYVDRTITAPLERQLYRQARAAMGDADWQTEAARELLERSLAIDPHGDAAFLLADSYFDRGEFDEAVVQYESSLEFDPTVVEAYLKLSAIHERRGRFDEALRVLREGADFFTDNVDLQLPLLDAEVEARFNAKAAGVHDHYRLAGRLLEREIERVSTKAGPAPP
jgi:tetratricopeptide (TPR) repeat protein